MIEKEIQILGFKKNFFNEYFNDPEYYYSYDIVRGLSLISNSSVEAEKEGWEVEIFNVEPHIKFSTFEEIQVFINSTTSKIVIKTNQ